MRCVLNIAKYLLLVLSFTSVAIKIPANAFCGAYLGKTRLQLFNSAVQNSDMAYKTTVSFDFSHNEVDYFDVLSRSTKTILIFNHVGCNDFYASMKLLGSVDRLDELRWVTLKGFKNRITGPMFDILDPILINQNVETDAEIIGNYADRNKNSNYAISLFPEGGILNRENYNKCLKYMPVDKIFPNLCTPRSGTVKLLLSAFEDADVFDVTLKYFDEDGSGDAQNEDFMGEKYSLNNVLYKGKAPNAIYGKVRQVSRPSSTETEDIKMWLNDLWIEKNTILNNMELPDGSE